MSFVTRLRLKNFVTLVLSLTAALALTRSARADWLVQNDGTRIETRGRWRTQGDWLFFTDATGAFRAILAKEVDLEASQIATRQGGSALPSGDATGAAPSATAPARRAAREAPAPAARAPVARAPAEQARSITLYTTSWCPYCKQARQLLDSLGVDYVEKDIETSAAARSELTAKAGRNSGVPVLEIDGKLVRGYNKDRIRELVGGGT